MDELGVEPRTFRMLSKRATNYATRPILILFVGCFGLNLNYFRLCRFKVICVFVLKCGIKPLKDEVLYVVK